MSLHSSAQLGLPSSVLDMSHSESLVLVQGALCVGSALLALDLLHLGLLMSTRQLTQLDFGLSIFGRCAIGPPLLTVSLANAESSASLRSFSQPDPVTFVPGCWNVGFSILVQSSAYLGLSMLVFCFSALDSPLSSQSLACQGFALLACGVAQSEPPMLVLDKVLTDSVLLLHGPF